MHKQDNFNEGLYRAENEHDACGVGMIVNIHGGKSHELVDSALKVLENMKHRGAEGADNKTGDGAGIMLSLMHLRTVPTNSDILGEEALATEPAIKQVFITGATPETLERKLYIVRKKVERRIDNKNFYICSLSSKNIVYAIFHAVA